MKAAFIWSGLGFALLAVAHYMGIFVAPKEAMMGDVGRILYVHVPTAWVALVTYLVAFVLAIKSLWQGKVSTDAFGSYIEVIVCHCARFKAAFGPNRNIWWTGSRRARPSWCCPLGYCCCAMQSAILCEYDYCYGGHCGIRQCTHCVCRFVSGVLCISTIQSRDCISNHALTVAYGCIWNAVHYDWLYFGVESWHCVDCKQSRMHPVAELDTVKPLDV